MNSTTRQNERIATTLFEELQIVINSYSSGVISKEEMLSTTEPLLEMSKNLINMFDRQEVARKNWQENFNKITNKTGVK